MTHPHDCFLTRLIFAPVIRPIQDWAVAVYRFQAKHSYIEHEQELLDETGARELFRFFSEQSPPASDFKKVEDDIVSACGGLPLALKLAGASLTKKTDLMLWQVSCSAIDLIMEHNFALPLLEQSAL
jgi:hypothetical protein